MSVDPNSDATVLAEIQQARRDSAMVTDLMMALTPGPRQAMVTLAYSLACVSVVGTAPGVLPSEIRSRTHELLDIIFDQVEKVKEIIK